MCGIAGILARDARARQDWTVLARMSDSIEHRGPDGHGFFISGHVGLAHRRLSIIDIEGGRQPMIDARRGHALVYNGELYNFQTMRAELEAAGESFVTRSDTEVLLRSARSTSFDWVRRLNGMFAFALWSESTRTLILGRDRLGIKPLFYTCIDGEFVFASEIKALLQHPGVSREVNAERVPEYLAFRCIAGTETMFKGISQIPPGHVAVISQHDLALRLHRYWPEPPLDPGETAEPPEAVREHIEATLRESVRRQLISDVPVGTFLSGGVDSSLITALARPFRLEAPLHTFSVGFNESDYDESSFAEKVATQVGATHHAVLVTEADYLGQLEQTIVQLDEPLNHAHTVQLQLLSRFAKSFVTVVLTGEGADELFGGYPRLHIPLLAKRLSWLPGVLANGLCSAARLAGLRRVVKLLEASANEREAVVHSARFVPMHDFEQLYPAGSTCDASRMAVYEELSAAGLSGLNRILKFDQQTYLPSLLSRLDKTSMASAVECRVPFLDNEVIDCSLRVPARMKVRVGRENKVALKEVAARIVPPEVVYRRKVGFGTPLTSWFRNRSGLGGYLDLLTSSTSRTSGYLDRGGVSALVEQHRNGAADHAEAVWGLLALELWHRHVVDGPIPKSVQDSWPDEDRVLMPVVLGAESPALHSGMTV